MSKPRRNRDPQIPLARSKPLRIPIKFEEAVAALLKVKPEKKAPKKKRAKKS